MAFMMSIRDKNPRPFTFELKMIGNLIARLDMEDFQEDAIFNDQLAMYLALHQVKFKEKFSSFLDRLSDGSSISLAFLEHLRKGEKAAAFFDSIIAQAQGFGKIIMATPLLSDSEKVEFLKLIISANNEATWDLQDSESCLSAYIISSPSILKHFSSPELLSKFRHYVEYRDIVFSRLDAPETTPELFDFIIDGGRFDLQSGIISQIINYRGTPESQDLELQQTANYTAVRLSGVQSLTDFIDAHLPEYVEQVLLSPPGNIKETEASLIALTNDDALTAATKVRLLKKQEIKITDLAKVPESLWEATLEAGKADVHWANVLTYHVLKGFTEQLANYLNMDNVYRILGMTKITDDKRLDESRVKQLWSDLLKDNRISDPAYATLLQKSPYYYSDFLIDSLPEPKISELIVRRVLRLSTASYNRVSSTAPEQRRSLIRYNLPDYLSNPTAYPLETIEFTYLLNNTDSAASRARVAGLITNEMLLADEHLASIFLQVIVQAVPAIPLGEDTIQLLLNKGTTADNIGIFGKYGHRFTAEQIRENLDKLGAPFDKLLITDLKELTTEADPLKKNLVTLLKRAGIIKEYSKKKGVLILYTKDNMSN